MRRFTKVLRSRELAALLIAGISAWAALGSSVPGWSASFSSPLFAAATIWLFMATTACAWERSKAALRWRDSTSHRRSHPSPLAREDAVQRLRALGLTITAEGESQRATRRLPVISRWASPVFHWSLAAGIALALAGSLFGSSHALVLAEGVPQPVTASGRSLTLTLAEVRPELIVDGITRGQAPRLIAASPGSETREDWSYPNHPLRFNGVTVHGIDSGPAVRMRIGLADGSAIETDVPLAARPAGGYEGGLAVSGGPSLRLTQAPSRRVVVELEDRSAINSPTILAEGESAPITPELTASFVQATAWASVSVVRDPTMPLLALVGMLACAAAAIALLYPPRAVRVDCAEEGCTFRIANSRLDPAFSRRVREALSDQRAED